MFLPPTLSDPGPPGTTEGEAEAEPLSLPSYELHGCYRLGGGQDPFFYDNDLDDLTISVSQSVIILRQFVVCMVCMC